MCPASPSRREGHALAAVWRLRGEPVHVPATGVTLDVVAVGEEHGPAVLLLMGLSGQRILWPRALVEGLVARGYRVVAFDHRDVGRSTVLDDAPVTLDELRAAMTGHAFAAPYGLGDLARDALGVLDHLGVAAAHVVGVSMGGMIAQRLAIDHASRVLSLTSINSSPGMSPPPVPDPAPAEVPDPRPPTDPTAFRRWFVDGLRVLSSARYFDEAETFELAQAVLERGVHPQGNLRHLLAILADGDRGAALAEVAVPTLVVHGADDPLIDVANGRATAAAVPGARLVVLEDMGHDLPVPLVPRITAAIGDHVAAAERAGTDGGRGASRRGAP